MSNIFTYQVTRGVYNNNGFPPPGGPSVSDPYGDRDELRPFLEVLDILSERYLEEISVDQLVDAAIKGMIDQLDDPQTNFLDVSSWEEMMIKTTGSFSGIGIEIHSVDDYITIIAPIKGTPGERAGLLAGDRIVEVDGQDIQGFTTMDAVKLMRGQEGTRVVLKVMRDGVRQPLTFEIVRGNIHMPSVFHSLLENKIGYIEITNFDDETGEDFKVALMELETKGMAGLILDLRDNPGGLLSEAVDVAQELLPAGPITHVVDREGEIINSYHSYGVAKAYPAVILVNGGSASASEIIAGAFQDSGAGILVGTKTYGKATVQHLEGLSNSTGIKYTIAKYRTPAGRDIHGEGLVPDEVVELPKIFMTRYHMLTADLNPGDENSSVFFLQQSLAGLGYNVTENGIFDSETEKAVRSFQTQQGIAVTGKVNQETRTKLQEEVSSILEKSDTQKQKAIELIMERI
jgi:carboxyl-terminal processing protease